MKFIYTFFLIFHLSFLLFSQEPEMVYIDYITVNHNTQLTEIKWSVISNENIDGYIVKRKIWDGDGVVDGTFNNIKIIHDNLEFFYIDNSNEYNTSSKPYQRSEEYRLASFKNVGNSVVYSLMSEIHKTIFVSLEYLQCDKQNKITWNSYKGWEVENYQVYVKTSQNDNYQLLTTTTDSSYYHKNIETNSNYYYYVKATSLNTAVSSNSNEVEIFTKYSIAPQMLNADYATVNSNNIIELKFTTDVDFDVIEYKLLRSENKKNNFDTIMVFQNNSDSYFYEDSVNIYEQFYYKFVAFDLCENEIAESNLAQNIVLNTIARNESTTRRNELNWNFYNFWLGNVEQYNIYKSYDNSDFELLISVYNDSIYNDDLSEFVYLQDENYLSRGKFCYYIEAIEGDSNPFNIKSTSQSNIECIIQEPIIYIPNAFNPNSSNEENRTFKPKISFVDEYLLIIYNRWGAKIFETNSIYNGWDGTIGGGTIAAQGTYTYFIKFRDQNNKRIEKTGYVNLITN